LYLVAGERKILRSYGRIQLQAVIMLPGSQRSPIRWSSSAKFLEYPLVAIAVGPDPAANEVRGHARGVIAIGDMATGFVAIAGIARGGIAIGGLAIGGIAFGGCAIGVLGFGGLALAYFAFGGLAIGYAAVGGLAIGVYAMGGVAFGKYVIGPLHRDPQAVEFFERLGTNLWPVRRVK
jgi:hypothetical protein